MPLINIKVIEGVFTAEQKQQLIERVTDAVVSIEGDALRDLTLVTLEEVKSGSWGVGGRPLTTEQVQALREGKAKPPRAA